MYVLVSSEFISAICGFETQERGYKIWQAETALNTDCWNGNNNNILFYIYLYIASFGFSAPLTGLSS